MFNHGIGDTIGTDSDLLGGDGVDGSGELTESKWGIESL